MEAKDTMMSDDDWEAINKKAGVDVIGIVINLDGKYSPSQQAALIVERCNLTAKVAFKAGTKAGIKKVAEFINDLIIGIEGCKFEERLDGDKGCIVLDMNENQWHAQLKKWGV